ncbi:MAG: DegT/DnrJ/EryC1/StrS family aminotransferase, partial [Anaerolineae bacterium]|nr:DegT/DnrJ/EryC1/StrS family aminotransferase [Anaerolineae bacterium]
FVDLPAQHRALRHELNEAIQRVLERADFALGRDVTEFEAEFAAFCGTEYAVGVDSGLAALELTLRAFGIGPGDEVIVPAHTFVATAAAVTFAGARPILVDVEQATYNIDVDQVEAAITPRTRAIIPVHLYGLPADMDTLLRLAHRHGLIVIEDACQAHGAHYNGRPAGSIGHAGAFSFYPTKNLGACGDAGIVVTDDASVAEQVRAMRNCGQREKYLHELPPFNHRMDTLQAAVLRVKLRYLEGWIEARRQNAALYADLLADSDVITPVETPGATHVYHLYVIRTSNRDALQAYLQEQGIGTAIHYPVPIHLQPFYAGDGFRRGQFPVTEQLCDQVLSLPMFPEMTTEQVRYVANRVIQFR